MIGREDLGKILNFVASRWVAESRNPDSKVMAQLPNNFWMNSVGGKTANGGFWVTSLMYTENEADAAAFREVLLRWQSRGAGSGTAPAAGGVANGGHGGGGASSHTGPDLIKISRMRSSRDDDDDETNGSTAGAGSDQNSQKRQA